MRLVWWCGVMLCGGMAVQGANAQRDMGAQQQTVSGNQSVISAMFAPVTGEPYQAEKVSRSVQTLSDGTVITHETRGTIARDAEGRMREDLYIVRSGQMSGHEVDKTLQSATVGDPVMHTLLVWTGDKGKVAIQMQLPSLPGSRAGIMGVTKVPPPPPAPGVIVKAAAPVALGTLSPNSAVVGMKDEVRTEELGQQSISGVLVTGKRVTTTIPTGKVGNDRPMVVVHEEWRSPELKIVVKTVDTDPRSGEQTMELEGLSRTDPDASLFQAPAGYQVKDMAETLKRFGELGKAKAQ
jgi:hypothetical protein